MKRILGFLSMLSVFLFMASAAFAWPAKHLTGVTTYNAEKAMNGFTLWAPQHSSKGATEPGKVPDEVYLLNMHGEVVHTWHTPFPVWYAKLLPDGTLLASLRTQLDSKEVPLKDDYNFMGGSYQIIMELDWDSKVLRQYRNPGMHHDFLKLENGNYMFLGWESILAAFQKKIKGGPSGTELHGKAMYGDTITEVNPDTGKVVWTWSSMANMDPKTEVIGAHYSRSEWTHFNTLDVLANGDIMTDSRRTDAAYIIDRKTGKPTWRWGGTVFWNEKTKAVDYNFTEEGKDFAPYLGGPHDCHVIKEGLPGAGNMLCFDNGMYADRSRAVEVTVPGGEVVWESGGNAFTGRNLMSHFISSAQRLPNGNTLLVDGPSGAFREVTEDNDVVWEYIRSTPNKAYLKWSVFRAFRYAPDYCPQLKSLGEPRMKSIVTPPMEDLNVKNFVKR